MLELNFTPFPYLITERLKLRKLKIDDSNEVMFLRSDERVNKYLDRQKANIKEDAKIFIRKIKKNIANNKYIYWAITYNEFNTLIGTICFFNIDIKKETAEIGYELHSNFYGKGIMQEAAAEVIKFGFSILKFKTIIAFTTADNEKSIKLLTRNRFKLNTNSKFGAIKELNNLHCYCLEKY